MSGDIDHPLMHLPKFGHGPGLRRVERLMQATGIDGREIARRAVVVTGSNGKGSTARILAELLHSAGDDVGLFTSPHLYRYGERFRINAVPAEDNALRSVMDGVLRAAEDGTGAFEAQFVVALRYFLEHGARWMVLEAGIGGRYDPVRLARAPVTGLTSLDLEHTELLGNTLQEIAFDKLDATPPAGLAVLGPSCLPLEADIRTYAGLTGIDIEFAPPGRDLGIVDGMQHFDLEDLPDLRSHLIGRHQIDNHAVAVRLCEHRLRLSDAPSVAARWREAIAAVEWPGRLERISPRITIDVGHSPDAIRAALAGFLAANPGRETVLVAGASRNKDAKGMMDILAPHFATVFCTAAHHNGMDAREIERLVRAANPRAATLVCPTIEDAVRAISADVRDAYVAGGLFLAAEFAETYRGGDPRAIRFF
jgi:dihydrofolate synthase / folylpolyglutamate synthase